MAGRRQKVTPPDLTPSEVAAKTGDKELALLFRAVMGKLSYVPWRGKLPADSWNAMVQIYIWDTYFPSTKEDDKRAWLHIEQEGVVQSYREQPEFQAVGEEVEEAFDAVAEEYQSGSFKSMVTDPGTQWKLFQTGMATMLSATDPLVAQRALETLTDRVEAKLVARQGEGGDTIFVIQGAHDGHILQRVNELKQLKAAVIDGEAEEVDPGPGDSEVHP